MINQNKWLNSLPKTSLKFDENLEQLNNYRWVNTIPKINTNNSVKKYCLIAVLFVCGLLFVSAVKNETRNLQKVINNLEVSINVIKFNLEQAILDNEVITSPENISKLAKEYLNTDLASYKRSQIKNLSDELEKFTELTKIEKNKTNKKKIKNLSLSVKSQVTKKIEQKKTEIRKLQELYENPKSIPSEIKIQVAKQIEEKKIDLKNIYSSPKDVFTLERVGRWSIIQVVKVFLGMPVVPGR